MTKIEKTNDAGAHVPQGDSDKGKPVDKKGRQDAPNYDKDTDGGRSIPVEDINSANDE